jgi:hypothetical protein
MGIYLALYIGRNTHGFYTGYFIFRKMRDVNMTRKNGSRFGYTIRRLKRALIVPFGTILLFILLASPALCQDNLEAEDTQKPALAKKAEQEKIPPEEMKQARDALKRLKETSEERIRMQNEQNMLLDRLSDLKQKNENEEMGPNKVISRRELEKTAAELHKILEQDRRIAQEQKSIVERLLANKEKTNDLIGAERDELRKKIERAEKNPEATPERIEQWRKNLEDLESIRALLEVLDKNPNALSILGYGPGVPPSAPEREEWRPGRFAEQRNRDLTPDRGARDRAGMRIFQQINQMEKQIQFLRNQLDRTEQNFNNLRDTLNKLREQHPEILEELRRENPERFEDHPVEPDPDFEARQRMQPERRRRQEAAPPVQNP